MLKKLKTFVVEHPSEIVAGCLGVVCVGLTLALKKQMNLGVTLNSMLDDTFRELEMSEDRIHAVTTAIENGGKAVIHEGLLVGKLKDGSLL